nr:MAG TPA: hypothetical protein [Caudoviricetes sp.]
MLNFIYNLDRFIRYFRYVNILIIYEPGKFL